jgi:Flp pilus assembly protein TadD
MIVAFLIATAPVATAPIAAPAPAPQLAEISHAIDAGRLDQARLMIARAIAAGQTGDPIERLLADLAFASGNNSEALPRYEHLLTRYPLDERGAERGGIAALRLGQVQRALPLITRATQSKGATWRAWDARGVIADLQSDWPAADAAYAHALKLAPGKAEVINNLGWSKLLRGDWAGAAGYLERAVALQPGSERIANNLELARDALAAGLPDRRHGETAEDWAARLNDAGVAAEQQGNRVKAIAAFTQALEASETWYARAANNLAAVTPAK